ncbi:MAG: LacI family transcriptional regulator [Lachnospiraceae bacterium]|nr:LacI family transcriptional regulator [Lachnospiraceae bacterium]
MVSIKDVANKAGVAISTVSKVLNDYPNVSEATKEKVMKAVEELNFVPNSVAAALSSKKVGRIALLVNLNVSAQAIDEIDMRYISGALQKAMDYRFDVITLFFFMFRDKTVDELIRYLQSQSISGIIIYGLSKEDLVIHELIDSKMFKCVAIDAPLMNDTTSCVSIDHIRAQYDVAYKTIKENTGNKVLYIAGKRNGYVTDDRIAAMKMLAEKENLVLDVKYGEFSEKEARELTFKYGKKANIIVCASDLMAIGSMKALQEMDIFRPVCGFDGTTLMGYVGQQMNTVRQDFEALSAKAVEELNNLFNGQKGRLVEMPYSLVQINYTDIIV